MLYCEQQARSRSVKQTRKKTLTTLSGGMRIPSSYSAAWLAATARRSHGLRIAQFRTRRFLAKIIRHYGRLIWSRLSPGFFMGRHPEDRSLVFQLFLIRWETAIEECLMTVDLFHYFQALKKLPKNLQTMDLSQIDRSLVLRRTQKTVNR